jgi:hypothetical protein
MPRDPSSDSPFEPLNIRPVHNHFPTERHLQYRDICK